MTRAQVRAAAVSTLMGWAVAASRFAAAADIPRPPGHARPLPRFRTDGAGVPRTGDRARRAAGTHGAGGSGLADRPGVADARRPGTAGRARGGGGHCAKHA